MQTCSFPLLPKKPGSTSPSHGDRVAKLIICTSNLVNSGDFDEHPAMSQGLRFEVLVPFLIYLFWNPMIVNVALAFFLAKIFECIAYFGATHGFDVSTNNICMCYFI